MYVDVLSTALKMFGEGTSICVSTGLRITFEGHAQHKYAEGAQHSSS